MSMQAIGVEGYRLSPQQKHLWRLQQNGSGEPFLAQCAVLIEGDLDRQTLKEALHTVINRHEILRTRFPLLPGAVSPLQVIISEVSTEIDERDLSHLNAAEQDAEIETSEDGAPHLVLRGTVAAAASRRGATSWHVSLSHDGGMAMAVVILES